MIISTNMGLEIPTIGSDNDPQWQQEIVYSFNKIDTHTHDGAGHGVKIPFNNLNFASPGGATTLPSLAGYPLIQAAYLGFTYQTTPPTTSAASTSNLVVDSSGNLRFVTPSGSYVISSSTGFVIPTTATGFLGSQYGQAAGFGGATSYSGGSGEGGPGILGAAYNNYFAFYQTTTVATSPQYGNNHLAEAVFSSVSVKSNSSPFYEIFDNQGVSSSTTQRYQVASRYQSFGQLPSSDGGNNQLQIGFGVQAVTSQTAGSYQTASPAFFWYTNNAFAATAPTTSSPYYQPMSFLFNSPLPTAGVDFSSTSYASYYFGHAANSTNGVPTTSVHSQYNMQYVTGAGVPTAPTFPVGYSFVYRIQTSSSASSAGNSPVMAAVTVNATDSTPHSRYLIAVSGTVSTAADGTYEGAVSNTVNIFGTSVAAFDSAFNSAASGSASGVFQTSVGVSLASITSLFGYVAATTPGIFLASQASGGSGGTYGTKPNSAVYANVILPGSSNASLGGNYTNGAWPAIYSTLLTSTNAAITTATIATLNVTGSITFPGGSGGAFVPTSAYTNGTTGTAYGLYTNTRVVACGVFTGTDSSSGGSPTLTGLTGANLSSGVASDGTLHGKKYVAVVITLASSVSANCMVLANVASYTVSGDADACVVLQATCSGTTATVYLANATGTTYPTGFTVNLAVLQFN